MAKLAHVCIETPNLAETQAFYAVLGLTRRFDFNNLQGELVGFYLAFDDDTFIEVIKNREPKNEGAIRHFCIEVEDVAATRSKLEDAGIAVSDKGLGIDHTLMITCSDPNGVFIEVQQYTAQSLQLNGGACQVDYRP